MSTNPTDDHKFVSPVASPTDTPPSSDSTENQTAEAKVGEHFEESISYVYIFIIKKRNVVGYSCSKEGDPNCCTDSSPFSTRIAYEFTV